MKWEKWLLDEKFGADLLSFEDGLMWLSVWSQTKVQPNDF